MADKSVVQCKIALDGRLLSYIVRRSAKARHVRLEIRPESGLTVVIPRAHDIGKVPGFLREKQGWILRHLARYDRLRNEPARTEIKAGDTILYFGRKLTVVTKDSRGNTVSVRLVKDRLTVSGDSSGMRLPAILEWWYRVQAAGILKKKVEKWSHVLKVSHNGITVRGQKTRWASCSRKGNLSFNWKLLMAPEPVIDYVVIHELAHLKEMNHSKKFWQVVAGCCPRWREMRKWLRQHDENLSGDFWLSNSDRPLNSLLK